MLRAILGKKLNMTRVYDKHNRSVPVSYIQTGPITVIAVKPKGNALDQAAQVGFEKAKRISKPLSGRLKKLGVKENFRYLKELPFKGEIKSGEIVKADEVFKVGDLVDITGISKGKGFAGVVKRHGFAGGPKTHGQSDRHRAPGSIGSGTTPGRVVKGLKMAGHMGHERTTIQGLEILSIDKENDVLGIKGALPGNRGNLLIIKKSIKKKKAYHEPETPAMPVVSHEEEKKEETVENVPVAQELSSEIEALKTPAEGEEKHA